MSSKILFAKLYQKNKSVILFCGDYTTKKSIDEAKTQRQLETLPKFTWVIEVQVQLEHWEKDLKEKRDILQKGVNQRNDEMFQKASDTRIKSPKDLSLNRFLYDNMPCLVAGIMDVRCSILL